MPPKKSSKKKQQQQAPKPATEEKKVVPPATTTETPAHVAEKEAPKKAAFALAMIKKLIYIGIVVLSSLKFVMLGRTAYDRYKENQRVNEYFRTRQAERDSLTHWDLPSVQQRMREELG